MTKSDDGSSGDLDGKQDEQSEDHGGSNELENQNSEHIDEGRRSLPRTPPVTPPGRLQYESLYGALGRVGSFRLLYRDEHNEHYARSGVENEKTCYYDDSESDGCDNDRGRCGICDSEECRLGKSDQSLGYRDEEVKWSDLAFDSRPDEGANPSLSDGHQSSPSWVNWQRLKREEKEENKHLDRMMSMIGYENVKRHFLDVRMRKILGDRWAEDSIKMRLDLVLHGKDRTAKKKIAQIYAEFLYSIGATPRRSFKRVTGYSLPDDIQDSTVVFFENAGKMNESDIKKILKTARKTRLILIFSYKTVKESSSEVLRCSLQAGRRFTDPLALEDHDEAETRQIFRQLVEKVEFGKNFDDAGIGILTRRVSRRRRTEGGNFDVFRAVFEEWSKVVLRWEKRLEKEWLEWATTHRPDKDGNIEAHKPNRKESPITKRDVLGPEPEDLRLRSEAWNSIQEMVGLQGVKRHIQSLFDHARRNYRLEAEGKDPVLIPLNCCFLGDPGVGKTTVALLYARILAQLGLVSKGEVIVKNPSDIIGPHLGASEGNMKEVLAEAKGNVLIIDDAHMLHTRAYSTERSDIFRAGIIDTLVANISGSPGEDLCVILIGYTNQMEQMLLNSNLGLQRRFPEVIKFEPYNIQELCQILNRKMARDGLLACDAGQKVAQEVLNRMRSLPRFGNGGDVENLLSKAKGRRQKRLEEAGLSQITEKSIMLEPQDFDPDYDRSSNADKNRDELFGRFMGFDTIVKNFREYQKMADGMRIRGIDPRPHIPWAFIFKGPAGTGKTSTARSIGRLFCDMGLISSSEVITCSVSDMIGEYVGHTGPKIINQFELGLGKVLFIDEAYRLAASDGRADSFHQEAVAEIVDAMTKPRYMSHMVVILAGYDENMEQLLRSNHGLRSRFPTHVTFPSLTPEHCYQLLKEQLAKYEINWPSILDLPTSEERQEIDEALLQLSSTKNWANGRDIETLARNLMKGVFAKVAEIASTPDSGDLGVTPQELMSALLDMLFERGGKLPPLRAKKPSIFTSQSMPQVDPVQHSSRNTITAMNSKPTSSENYSEQGSFKASKQASKGLQSSITELKDIDHDPIGADEIRLLEVHPGKPGEILRGTFRIHPQKGAPSYYPLAGRAEEREPLLWMECNGTKTPIKTSLHTILNGVRKQSSSVLVWAEEICGPISNDAVNRTSQEKPEAKNQQPQPYNFTKPSVAALLGLTRESEPQRPANKVKWFDYSGHKYEPLDPHKRQIRLAVCTFKQNLSELDLSITFKSVSLLEKPVPRYKALSYVWASTDPTLPNYLQVPTARPEVWNKMRMRVFFDCDVEEWNAKFENANLRKALYSFYEVEKNNLENNSFTVWADALCINQTDPDERTSQVSMMASIYKAADEVWAWLGPFNAAATRGLDEIDQWSAFYETHLDELDAFAVLPGKKPKRENPNFGNSNPFETLLTDAHQLGLLTTDDDSDRAPFPDNYEQAPLLRATPFMGVYWTRAWIFQELAFSSRAFIMAGKRRVTLKACVQAHRVWSFFGALRNYIRNTCEDYAWQSPLLNPNRSFWKFVGRAKSQPMGWMMDALDDIRQPDTAAVIGYLSGLSLDFVTTFTRFRSTDPRDKIFALWGFVQPDGRYSSLIKPDYKLGVREVYSKAAQHLILAEKSLDILACFPMINELPEPTDDLDLPSWVPDWRRYQSFCPFTPIPGAGRPRYPQPANFAELVQFPAAGTLRVRGHLAGTIVDSWQGLDVFPYNMTLNGFGMLFQKTATQGRNLLSEYFRLSFNTENETIPEKGALDQPIEINADFSRVVSTGKIDVRTGAGQIGGVILAALLEYLRQADICIVRREKSGMIDSLNDEAFRNESVERLRKHFKVVLPTTELPSVSPTTPKPQENIDLTDLSWWISLMDAFRPVSGPWTASIKLQVLSSGPAVDDLWRAEYLERKDYRNFDPLTPVWGQKWWCYFVTCKGRLGICHWTGPPHPGDEIYRVAAHYQPIILRPVGNNKYKKVGNCFVMDEELRMLNDNGNMRIRLVDFDPIDIV